MMERRISVISVNYNGYDLTCAMIDSLRRHVTTPLEIVIVDNGSTRDEAAPLRERYPDVKVLRSERNLGFAGGNNLGFAAATGDYLLLLNNDTEVTEDTLHYLRETLDNDRSIGAVCPKIRFFAPPQHIQFAGYTPLTRITLRNALIGFGEPDDGRYDTPHDTPYAHGAAMMVRRETLEKAGPMPEIYFLYYEELDWSVRIREQGRRIVYDPRCTTSGEDKELEALLLRQGIYIDYIDGLRVLDEKVQGEGAYYNQRRRWIAAQFYALGSAVRQLPGAIAAGNLDYCDKLLQWCLPPRILLMGLVPLWTAAMTVFDPLGSIKWWIVLLLLLFALALALPDEQTDRQLGRALRRMPVLFLLTAANLFRLRGTKDKFIHTEHTGAGGNAPGANTPTEP